MPAHSRHDRPGRWFTPHRTRRTVARGGRRFDFVERLERRLLLSVAADPFEPNDSLASAAGLGHGLGVHVRDLTIHTAQDEDWYRFELLRPDSVSIRVDSDELAGVLDLSIHDSAGQPVGVTVPDAGGATATTAPLAPGVYFARVAGDGEATGHYDLSIVPGPQSATRVFYVNDNQTTGDFFTTATGNNAHSGLSPSAPKASLQAVLDSYVLTPTDVVVIDTGVYSGSPTLTSGDEGVLIAGSPGGAHLMGTLTIQDADHNLIHGLTLSGLRIQGTGGSPATGNLVRDNVISSTTTSAVELVVADGTVLSGNSISGGTYGVRVLSHGSYTIEGNTISGSTNGIYVQQSGGTLVATVQGNTVTTASSSSQTGIYASGLAAGTRIEGNTVAGYRTAGIRVDSGIEVAGNDVSGATVGTGIASTHAAALIRGNMVSGSQVGIAGRGVLGGGDWSPGEFNVVSGNVVGIATDQSGTVIQFNRVLENETGIRVTHTGATVHHNVVARNTQAGILVEGTSGTNIASNTVYVAPGQGSGVRLRNNASAVTLTNNILWAAGGYALHVANDSQGQFQSNFNNLYQSGTGRIVWWQKPFGDLFDWQVEANLDVDSIGYTALAPTLDDPRFVDLAGGDFRLLPGSTSVDAGDPTSALANELSPNGGRIDLGAYGNTPLATASPAAAIELVYPNYYSDWEHQVGRPIRWRTSNVTGNVRLELLEVGVVEPLAEIAVVAAADGFFTWSPADGGIAPSATRQFQIRISSVDNPALEDVTREWFSVPVDGSDFYLNDASSAGDEYTTALGNNRNTGKTPADPKGSLVALVRAYSLGPGDVLHIDTGTYHEVRDVVLSGAIGVGDDEGMAIKGPTAGTAVIDRGNDAASTTAIELRDADFVDIRRLTFSNAGRGLWVRENSTNFTGYDLVATNNSVGGIVIDSSSSFSVVDRLHAHHNGGVGVSVAVPQATFSQSSATNNAGTGISVTMAAGSEVFDVAVAGNSGTGLSVGGASGAGNTVTVRDVTATGNGTGLAVSGNVVHVHDVEAIGNTATGVSVSASSSVGSLVQRVLARNNGTGISVSGGVLVGDTDLAAGNGNRVHNNAGTGISASQHANLTIAGNAVHDNGGTGIHLVRPGGIGGGPGGLITRNVVFRNQTGIISYHGQVAENRVYANAGTGIHTFAGSGVRRNIVYSNQIGILTDYYEVRSPDWPYEWITFVNATPITHNLVYDHAQYGIQIISGQSIPLVNNTIYEPAGDAIWVMSRPGSNGTYAVGLTLRNNIVWVQGGYALNIENDSKDGFSSDHNLFHTTLVGQVARWQGTARPTLVAWQQASFLDQNSVAGDPLFVDHLGPDEVLGYVTSLRDGRDDNFHVQSQYGSFKGDALALGGGLAPVFDSASGLPAAVTGSHTADAGHSAAIDRGAVGYSFADEPAPNGGYINMGVYGGTSQASISPEEFVLVMRPDGGESWSLGQTFPIRWRTHAQSGTVDIELLQGSDPLPVSTIASGTPDDGEYLWNIPEELPPADDYRIRVRWGAVDDTSNADFAITPRINRYYVNDGFVQPGDWTTAAGDDANDGKSSATPKASIRAVLEAYDLEPGDEIWVDAGIYVLGSNIIIGAEDAGVRIVGFVGTNGSLPRIRRDSTTPGSHAFELQGASGVTIQSLEISGAHVAIAAGSAADVTVQNTILVGNTNAAVTSSGANFTFVDNVVADSAQGVWLSGAGAVVSGNQFTGHAGAAQPWPISETHGAVTITGPGGVVIDNQIVDSLPGVNIYGGGTAALVTGNGISGSSTSGSSSNSGIRVAASGATVAANSIRGHYYGINVNSGLSGVLVTENDVAQADTGIYAHSGLVTGNMVSGNRHGIYTFGTSTIRKNVVQSNRETGIYAQAAALVEDNLVYSNDRGLQLTGGATARGNTAYANRGGVLVTGTAQVEGNTLHSNQFGLTTDPVPFSIGAGGTRSIQALNNLIYGNAVAGMVLYENSGSRVENNTIYQPAGDAVRVTGTSSNVALRNNLLHVAEGVAIDVAASGQTGFTSDYNLFDVSGTGRLGRWGAVEFDNRVDWFYELGLDRHSLTADPLLVDPAGPDGRLGLSPAVGSQPKILDNGDAGFVTSGFGTQSGGYGGTHMRAGSGAATATLTFSDLVPGQWYQISATWVQNTGSSPANMVFTLSGTSLPAVQYASGVEPVGFVDLGVTWQPLGYLLASDETLVATYTKFSGSGSASIDAMRLDAVVDGAADDDFGVLPGSPTIDAGDPATPVLREGGPNGGRVNIGHLGNTAAAASSPPQMVQVLAPNGLEKVVAGRQSNIQWRSSGLAEYDQAARINAGSTAVGIWQSNQYQVSTTGSGTGTTTQPIDISAVADPAPEAVYQSYATSSSTAGQRRLAWHLPAADGDYLLRLHFMEYATNSIGGRRMDVMVNGQTVAAEFDIRAAAGARYKAVVLELDVAAVDGEGLLVELIGVNTGAIISGLELWRVQPLGAAGATVALDYSTDLGQSWTTIAAGLAIDRLGRGSYAWTPPAETLGNTALVRVRADGAAGELADESDEPFLIANAGQQYYVNDTSTDGDLVVTAAGHNAASGKSPDQPLASLFALLTAYDLEPGDVVYVETGTYNLLRNIELGPQHSGAAGNPVRIEGAGVDLVLIDRGDRTAGRYAFHLSGADHVTLARLGITGAYVGIFGTQDSDDVTIESSLIFANNQAGVHFDGSGDRIRVLDSEFYGLSSPSNHRQSYGIRLEGTEAHVEGNLLRDFSQLYLPSNHGSVIRGNTLLGVVANVSGAGVLVEGNLFENATSTALSISGATTGEPAVVRDNRFWNVQSGISATRAIVEGNAVVRETRGGGTGIAASGSNVRGNVVAGFAQHGIQDSGNASTIAVIEHNRVYNNGSSGIYSSNEFATTAIRANVVYSNAGGGIRSRGASVEANLVYANANYGISYDADLAVGPRIVGNTVFQLASPALYLERLPRSGRPLVVAVHDNILSTQAGSVVVVGAHRSDTSGIVSDDNLFWPVGAATFVTWGTSVVSREDWYYLFGQDAHSLVGDPLFVNPSGSDGVLGYLSLEQDGRDDDFHVQSPHGTYAGGMLAPVLDAVSGLPVYLEGTWTTSAALSPAIDRARLADDVVSEPHEHGGRRNLGAYGGTAQASLSPAAGVQLLAPLGLAKLQHGEQVDIEWRSWGLATDEPLAIELLLEGQAEPVLAVAEVAAGAESFVWTVPAELAESGQYRLRIRALDHAPIADVHQAPLAVANALSDYYVSPTGSNLHTGKSPDAPLASIAAVLRAYALSAGDVIHVAPGEYLAISDIQIGPEDSGLTIRGPLGDEPATISRGGTSGGTAIFVVAGATDVTIENLTLTDAAFGIEAQDASRFVVRNNTVFGISSRGVRLDLGTTAAHVVGNTIHGVVGRILTQGISSAGPDALIEGNLVHTISAGNPGIDVTGLRSVVRGNEVYQAGIGIRATHSSTPAEADRMVVENNVVHSNTTRGITSTRALVRQNTVYGQTGSSAAGIEATGGEVRENVVSGNQTGITASGGTWVVDNRVFNNTTTGIVASGGRVERNRVYSNATGVRASGGTSSVPMLLHNNVIYANTNTGVWLNGQYVALVNNTVYQNVGDSVLLSSASNATLRNNIVWINRGYAVRVADSTSQTNLLSNYNLLYAADDPLAFVGQWGGVARQTLADWQAATARDANSIGDDPLFVDPDGANNILGYTAATGGFDGGADDNFQLRAGSPAIDRGYSWSRPPLDQLDRGRLDDPGSPNLGSPDYRPTLVLSSGVPLVGTARNWRADDSTWSLSLPFAFPFYGTTHTSVSVSSKGFVFFGSPPTNRAENSAAKLIAARMIAPLWDDLRTNGEGDDIFTDTTVPGQVTIRWNATNKTDGADVQFALTLFDDGTIRFDYGATGEQLSPTVGISAGGGLDYWISSYSDRTTLEGLDSVLIELAPGFVDLGAYEFRGSSFDATPPVIVDIAPADVLAAGVLVEAPSEITVHFSEPLDAIDIHSPANYELRSPGPNGVFGDGDDVLVALVIDVVDEQTVRLVLADALADGTYRLVVSPTSGLRDTAGLALDGNGDGQPGGTFQRFFNVNTPPVAHAGGPYLIAEGDSLLLDASGSLDPTPGDVLSYAWDLNGDGEYDDAVGLAPTLDWSTLEALGLADGPSTWLVRVRATDSAGNVSYSEAVELVVLNAPPAIELAGTTSLVAGAEAALLVMASDPSAADQAAGFTYEIDWDGDGAVDASLWGPSGTLLTHVFGQAGSYDVRVRAIDRDGDASDWQIWTIDVESPPELLLVAGPSQGTANEPINFSLAVQPADPHAPQPLYVAIDIDRDGLFETMVAVGVEGGSVDLIFAATGLYEVAFALLDAELAVVYHAAHVIDIVPAEVRPDDDEPELVHLVWGGTSGDDHYVFEQLDETTILIRTLLENGQPTFVEQVITGVTGQIKVYAGAGNDRIDLRGVWKPALIDGGPGDDTLYGGAGDDVIYGDGHEGRGNDFIDGGAGNDVIYGDGAEGRAPSGEGRDTIYGGDGDDTIMGDGAEAAGGDWIDGGAGDDLIYGDGDGPGTRSAADTIFGGAGNDVIVADGAEGAAANLIDAGEGDDIVLGGRGSDTILGGPGRDLLIGGGGADHIDGGEHSDLLIADRLVDVDLADVGLIHAEWVSARPLAERVDNLMGRGEGPRENGDVLLTPGATLALDGAVDTVLGGPDDDWLLVDVELDETPDYDPLVDVLTSLRSGPSFGP